MNFIYNNGVDVAGHQVHPLFYLAHNRRNDKLLLIWSVRAAVMLRMGSWCPPRSRRQFGHYFDGGARPKSGRLRSSSQRPLHYRLRIYFLHRLLRPQMPRRIWPLGAPAPSPGIWILAMPILVGWLSAAHLLSRSAAKGVFGLTPGPATITGGATAAIQVGRSSQHHPAKPRFSPCRAHRHSPSFALTIDGGKLSPRAPTSLARPLELGARCSAPRNFNRRRSATRSFPGNANCVVNTLIGALGIQNGASASYGTAGHAPLSGSGVSTKNAWDTAGVSCTLTTVSHLTVVNGIVTLCN